MVGRGWDDSSDEEEEDIIMGAILFEYFNSEVVSRDRVPGRKVMFTGIQWVMECLGNRQQCYDLFRMWSEQSRELHDILSERYHLQLGGGLNQIGKPHIVDTIKPDEGSFQNVHHSLHGPIKRYFSGCVGALDGTYVPITISMVKHPTYVNFHHQTSFNVLVACDFNQKFIYTYGRRPGLWHDARILHEAYNNPTANFPKPPEDKYFVVDSAYANTKGFLAPLQGKMYHLPSFRRARGTKTKDEYFNYRHAQVRNVIERAIGVWKGKFRINKGIPCFDFITHNKIVMATLTIHNFLVVCRGNDNCVVNYWGTSTSSGLGGHHEEEEDPEVHLDEHDDATWASFCDGLAAALWANRPGRNRAGSS